MPLRVIRGTKARSRA